MANLLKRERGEGWSVNFAEEPSQQSSGELLVTFRHAAAFHIAAVDQQADAPAPIDRLDCEPSSYDDACDAEFN
jgi:hypothetical protein